MLNDLFFFFDYLSFFSSTAVTGGSCCWEHLGYSCKSVWVEAVINDGGGRTCAVALSGLCTVRARGRPALTYVHHV